jgi:hypothetical protein
VYAIVTTTANHCDKRTFAGVCFVCEERLANFSFDIDAISAAHTCVARLVVPVLLEALTDRVRLLELRTPAVQVLIRVCALAVLSTG